VMRLLGGRITKQRLFLLTFCRSTSVISTGLVARQSIFTRAE
jgi:hypothetical protein